MTKIAADFIVGPDFKENKVILARLKRSKIELNVLKNGWPAYTLNLVYTEKDDDFIMTFLLPER